MESGQQHRLRRFVNGILLGLCTLFVFPSSLVRAQQAGQVDPTFGVASLGLVISDLHLTPQSDGKLIAVGNFTRGIIRLNADGTTDTGFQARLPSGTPILLAGSPDPVAVQPDGKILLGGVISASGLSRDHKIIRLNTDGLLDTSFNPLATTNSTDFVYSIVLQPDGKIVAAGTFTQMNGVACNNIVRLNADGTVDPTYTATAYANSHILRQTDGKIVLYGYYTRAGAMYPAPYMARLNSDGSVDAAFAPTFSSEYTAISAVAIQTDGKMIIGGGFSQVNGVTRSTIARLNANGTLDTSYIPSITTATYTAGVSALTLQPDGKCLVAGYFDHVNGIAKALTCRLNSNGSLDTTFTADADVNVNSVVVRSDGTLVLGGAFTQVNGIASNSVALVSATGVVNTAFIADLTYGPNNEVDCQILLSDGRMLIAGRFTEINGIPRRFIARLNVDGSLDRSFDPGPSLQSTVSSIVRQPDGKILVSTYRGLQRLGSNGAVDTTFNVTTDYDVQRVALQSDGKIVLVGGFMKVNAVAHNYIARVNADGSLDATFNPSSLTTVSSVALQESGKILVGGYLSQINGVSCGDIARLNSDGTLDTTFPGAARGSVRATRILVLASGRILAGSTYGFIALTANGVKDTTFNPPSISANGFDVQADNKVVVVGQFSRINNIIHNCVARLNADGTLDPTYNPSADRIAYTVTIQPDGKAIVGGLSTVVNGSIRNYIARLNVDGTLDTGFVPGVGVQSVNTLSYRPDNGSVTVGGSFISAGGKPANALARLRPDGALDTTFTSPFSTGDSVPSLVVQTNGNLVVSALVTSTTNFAGLYARAPLRGPNAIVGPHTDSKIKNPIVRCSFLNGSVDTGFSAAAGTDGTAFALGLQADGRIVLGGSFASVNAAVGHLNLGRLNADGTLDASFTASANATVQSVLVQADGRLVLGGIFTQVNTATRSRLARLNTDGSLDPSFSASAGTDGPVASLKQQRRWPTGGRRQLRSGRRRGALVRGAL